MQFSAKNRVGKVLHFSSSAVYEGVTNPSEHPLTEDCLVSPKLMYPMSKWLSELYMEAQAKIHGIPTFSIRLFNLYGPHQDYFRAQLPLLGYLFKCLITGVQQTIFGKKGSKREYVYIDDLVKFLEILIVREPHNKVYDNINVGSGHSYDVFDIISKIECVTAIHFPYKTGQPKYFWDNFQQLKSKKIHLPEELLEAEVNKIAYADLTKAQSYGYNPIVELDEGLLACYKEAKEYFR